MPYEDFRPSQYNSKTENDNSDKILIPSNSAGHNTWVRRDYEQTAPYSNEPVSSYLQRLIKVNADLENENVAKHINGRTTWYTHRRPEMCFMCAHITNMWEIHGQFLEFTRLMENQLGIELFQVVYSPTENTWVFSKNYKSHKRKKKIK